MLLHALQIKNSRGLTNALHLKAIGAFSAINQQFALLIVELIELRSKELKLHFNYWCQGSTVYFCSTVLFKELFEVVLEGSFLRRLCFVFYLDLCFGLR
jgi:hypothetical protein